VLAGILERMEPFKPFTDPDLKESLGLLNTLEQLSTLSDSLLVQGASSVSILSSSESDFSQGTSL